MHFVVESKVVFIDGISINDVGLSISGDHFTMYIGADGDFITVENFLSLANTVESFTFESGGEYTAEYLFQLIGISAPTVTETKVDILSE